MELTVADPNATRAVVILREAPSTAVLARTHRLLGLGLGDIRQRAASGSPLVDVELFGNDHTAIDGMLRTLLIDLDGLHHTVHECIGDEPPSRENEVTADLLRNVLEAHRNSHGAADIHHLGPAREDRVSLAWSGDDMEGA